MAVTTGSFTVGGAGDYGTWKAAVDDVGSSLSGDLTFTQIADTTETAPGAPAGDVNLNGHNLLLCSDTPHEGDPTAGWWIDINYLINDPAFFIVVVGAEGTSIEVKDLKFKRLAGSGASGHPMLRVDGKTVKPALNVHDLMFDFNGQAVGTGLAVHRSGNNPDVHVWNCVVWGGGSNGIHSAWNVKDQCHLENNVVRETAEKCYYVLGDASTYGAHLHNDLAVPDAGVGYSGPVAVHATHNATSLAAVEIGGTDNVVNVVEADEFVSLSDASSDFMKVKAGRLDTEGATPEVADNDLGIRGNARPGADAAVSIGADELEVAGGPAPRSMVVMT